MLTYPSLEEVQRLQYLQALGVTSWLPTGPLVASQVNTCQWQPLGVQESEGAAHSNALNVSVLGSSVSSSPRDSALAPSAVQSVANAANQEVNQEVNAQQMQAEAVAQALGALDPTIHQPDDSQVSQQRELAKQASVALPAAVASMPMPAMVINADRLAPIHLGLSWYSNGVLVVNDIPVQEGAAMSSPIQRLQTAIVNALRPISTDTSAQVMPAASMEFNWPLVPGPHADHSLTGAQSGLKYSIIKLLKENSCSKLLIMGPAAIQLLKPDMTLGETAYIELADGPIQSVYSHSLHQLLAVPSLKSDTWQHLQPLIPLGNKA
jgi:hypothetical protein|tara:strand:- start:199 stop:1164 length:966 start_codon:yes stop_codon:yes gene_type:complete